MDNVLLQLKPISENDKSTSNAQTTFAVVKIHFNFLCNLNLITKFDKLKQIGGYLENEAFLSSLLDNEEERLRLRSEMNESDKRNSFQCLQCYTYHISESAFRSHTISCSVRKSNVIPPSSISKQPNFDKLGCSKPSSNFSHMFGCPFCATVAYESELLMSHITEKHEEQIKGPKCALCEFCILTPGGGIDDRHLMSHSPGVHMCVDCSWCVGGEKQLPLHYCKTEKRLNYGHGFNLRVISGRHRYACQHCEFETDAFVSWHRRSIAYHLNNAHPGVCGPKHKSIDLDGRKHTKIDAEICALCGKFHCSNRLNLDDGSLSVVRAMEANGEQIELFCTMCNYPHCRQLTNLEFIAISPIEPISELSPQFCIKDQQITVERNQLIGRIEPIAMDESLHLQTGFSDVMPSQIFETPNAVWESESKSCQVMDDLEDSYLNKANNSVETLEQLMDLFCSNCGLSFEDNDKLTKHKMQCLVYTCVQCNLQVTGFNNLKAHQKREHKNMQKERKTLFVCDLCEKVCQDSTQLRDHKNIHTGLRPHKCSLCGLSFKHKSNLREHVNVIHTKPKIYTCEVCSKEFNRPQCYKIHSLIHTGERQFSCSECDRAFLVRHELNKHIKRVHNKN